MTANMGGKVNYVNDIIGSEATNMTDIISNKATNMAVVIDYKATKVTAITDIKEKATFVTGGKEMGLTNEAYIEGASKK